MGESSSRTNKDGALTGRAIGSGGLRNISPITIATPVKNQDGALTVRSKGSDGFRNIPPITLVQVERKEPAMVYPHLIVLLASGIGQVKVHADVHARARAKTDARLHTIAGKYTCGGTGRCTGRCKGVGICIWT